tara:strand:+ start:166 stop:474 length:309 start_codon:yes stop_codon:yes gene_type:complete
MILLVYTLFGSAEAAERVAGQMVRERLAACANMLAPCISLYEWQEEMQRQTEFPVLFKTTADRRDALMARIGELHDYETPAIVAMDADAVPGFADWVGGQVG